MKRKQDRAVRRMNGLIVLSYFDSDNGDSNTSSSDDQDPPPVADGYSYAGNPKDKGSARKWGGWLRCADLLRRRRSAVFGREGARVVFVRPSHRRHRPPPRRRFELRPGSFRRAPPVRRNASHKQGRETVRVLQRGQDQRPARRCPAPCPWLPASGRGSAHLPARPSLALPLEIYASSSHQRHGEDGKEHRRRFLYQVCELPVASPRPWLDEVEIEYAHRFEYDHAWISTWIRHALSCQAQVLTVKYPLQGYTTRYLDGPPLVSRYLRRLEISGVRLKSNFLSFSSCSTLEDLKIEGCDLLETSSILSQSLKHLSIKDCYFKYDGRVHISVPNLVSLQLKSFGGRIPLLESMMSLETAVVEPSNCFMDYCLEGVAEGCCGTCGDCCGNDDHNGGCVLLGGLSRAKNLELIADPMMFIFRRDLRWCPTFSRLKTLLLSEWCVQPDLHVLVCMLEHSPVLENLTLQLRKQVKHACAVEVEENPGLMEKPAAISGYLKTIKVKCEEVDDRVCRVQKFLSTFGIEITI